MRVLGCSISAVPVEGLLEGNRNGLLVVDNRMNAVEEVAHIEAVLAEPSMPLIMLRNLVEL